LAQMSDPNAPFGSATSHISAIDILLVQLLNIEVS